MTMPSTSRRIAGALVAVMLLAAGVLAYVYRDRPEGSESEVARLESPGGSAGINIDDRRQQLIGVRLARVERAPLASMARTTGVVRYDETRLADMNVKVEGWIRELFVDYTGQAVRRGQPLFSLYSPELLTAQNEFLFALKTRDQISESQAAEARSYADRLADAARQRLLQWDLPPDQIRKLEETRQPQPAMTFISPASGYVIEKQAVNGMHVTPGQTLYRIADLSSVWIEADVYEQDMPGVSVGQRATVTLDAYPGVSIAGRAVNVFPLVEEKSRTIKVRFQVANPGGRLKPGMYANVELETRSGTGLTVPANAVLDSGNDQTVFVAQGEGRFTPTRVKVGRRVGQMVEILEGVTEGEQVASSAAFFIDSESQLRAGLQNYEVGDQQVEIAFRSLPDPPRSGDNTFEVTVKARDGAAVTDADVTLVLFMPAMPTMNMPAMRSETKLAPVAAGLYRGQGQVMMAGGWDVTVAVSRSGTPLGSKRFALAAR